MFDGFLKVASASPRVFLGDSEKNSQEIIKMMNSAYKEGVKAMVFPELSITGYTLGDLFFSSALLENALDGLESIADASSKLPGMVVFVGLPIMSKGKIYNTSAVVNNGAVIAFIAKKNIPNYLEYYESRWFTPSPGENEIISTRFGEILMGHRILLQSEREWDALFSVEICEDLWVPSSNSVEAALNGANVIFNLSASDEIVLKEDRRYQMIRDISERLIVGYVYADASDGESSTDMVFASNLIIGENGTILKKSIFESGKYITADIDLQMLNLQRARRNTYEHRDSLYDILPISLGKADDSKLERAFDRSAFIPQDEETLKRICERATRIQAIGLKRRIEATGSKKLVLGVSGGLDSTLALLSSVKALDFLMRPHSDLICVSMPSFGTTERTKSNAQKLSESLSVDYREIDITETVRSHFRDIGHSEEVFDVVFENAQARERTQILMDIANGVNGLVVGTGDLSELALGFATYNGDHMSSYGINAGIPKSMVRNLVSYYIDESENEMEREALEDILKTPVSPELLPAKDGVISQETENIVGPYELHDFFLYHFVKNGFSPKKIYRIASIAFDGKYEKGEIKKWLIVFLRRFFTQQFKRSALPDGPKVVSVSLSPRSDWRMPSDALKDQWIKEAENL